MPAATNLLLVGLPSHTFVRVAWHSDGEHSCDKRSSKTYISTRFPFLDFEPGFAEEDPWWKPDEKETFEHHMGRTAHFLEQVFAHDKATFVGLWGHHGNVRAAQRLCLS